MTGLDIFLYIQDMNNRIKQSTPSVSVSSSLHLCSSLSSHSSLFLPYLCFGLHHHLQCLRPLLATLQPSSLTATAHTGTTEDVQTVDALTTLLSTYSLQHVKSLQTAVATAKVLLLQSAIPST